MLPSSSLSAAAACLDGHRSLLEGARQPQLPDPVAEVAAKLAEDRRRRVGDEAVAALGVEAVERLDQAEARDLDQVLELLGGAAVAKREGARQGQEAPDQLLLKRGSRVSRSGGEARPRRPRPTRPSRSRSRSVRGEAVARSVPLSIP